MSGNVTHMPHPSCSSVDDIIRYIKCFNGDIIGGYVRDKVACLHSYEDLDCRVDRDLVHILLNILSLHYRIRVNPDTVNYARLDTLSYFLTPRTPSMCEFRSLKLDVLCCTIAKWASYSCDFDVNMLAENNTSLYIRPNLCNNLSHIPDRLTSITERCENRHFALVSLPRVTYQDIMILLIRSKDLVSRGWIMDDIYLGKDTFIINTWSNIINIPENIRTEDDSADTLTCQHECSLCREPFKNEDIVLNTCCHHNFHWECHPEAAEKGGIMQWFTTKQTFSCPYCRQNAVHFSFLFGPV